MPMFDKTWRKKHATPKNIGLVAAFAILFTLIGIGFSGLTNVPVATGEFDVLAWDGGRGVELPSGSFNWTLYGVEGNDLTDFATYDVLTTGTSLADISTSDLDTDYDQFVLKANGKVLKSWWDEDEDEPKIEQIDTTYDHSYYVRWFVLNSANVNYLVFYETASFTALIVADRNNGTIISGPIVAKQNVTIVTWTNMSQPFARYATGANYANEENDAPNFVVVFNETVSVNSVFMNGASKSRVNDTAIRFTFGVLSSTPSVFSLMWDTDVIAKSSKIISITEEFGDEILA